VKECSRRLNVKVALNACAKKAVSIRQEAAWQLHSRMRQACSSRLHARNCFQFRGCLLVESIQEFIPSVDSDSDSVDQPDSICEDTVLLAEVTMSAEAL